MAETQRLFFALSLPQEIKHQIQAWRSEALPWHSGHPIAWENYHLTLAFLGEVSPGQRQSLCRLAGRIQQPAFRLTLDDAGHWPRSGAVWIGPKHPPRGLNQLANLLRSQAARSGCYQAPMPFHPHVTLYRQVHQAIALPAPGFGWSFAVEKFTLFSATLKQGKTRYQSIDEWSLSPQKET